MWWVRHDDSIDVKLYIKTNAPKTQFGDLYGEPIEKVLKVQALPVEGAANKNIIKFIAKLLRLKQSQVEIISGLHSKHKTIRIYSSDLDQIEQRLLEL